MTKSMLQMEEDRDMWRKLFEDCNKKQGQEIERLRQEYKERSEQVALTTAVEKVIPARDIPRGQSPMELLTPREMSQTTETRLPAETNRVTIPDPSDTLGDPVVEQTVRKLIETAGRLVANKNAPGSGVTAPYGTIDDTGRVQLSQTVIRQGISNVTPLMGSSRIPERKVRKMPAKKVSRIIDVQKNNQLKYNFTGVPETDPRACFNRATWSPAVNLQQPPLGTSHLILGDSLVRVLSNLRTSWVTTVMAFGGATIAQLYRMVELMNPGKIPNVMILVGTNDISRGSDEQEALWESMMVCLFTTLWQKFSCAVLTVCTVPMNARSLTASGRRHNEGVMRWNNILRNLANRNAGRMILMDIEHELRAMDQARLTTDGIHFDSIEGQAWLNRVFQERLDELEAELFDTGVLKEEGTVSDAVITTFVPPSLETRLGTVPAVTNYRQQSSSEPGRRTDVQDRLGEAPMRRTIHPRRRIGPVNQPIEEVAGTSRSDTRSETTSTSREERPSRGSLLWSRSIPSPWHIYKDELMKLDLQRVSFIEDARRMLNGATLSVSRLYSITGVDWLIAASINFSSTTALRFADLEGLPSNNTMGPVNARPLQDVRLNHDEGNREERPGRFLTARAPIGQHVKIFRQLTTPPGHVKERVYPKLVNQDGDAQRYGGLTAIKKDETIFAAYDKAEMRKAKIMVVANSEFVYTSKSLFWPDVIMLAAVDLDLLQSVSLAIGVQRQTDMNPITIVFAGINDHLHSRGFLSRLRDPATAENAVWPAIKDILESMGEVVDATKEGSFNKVALRVVFALSPGYAHLPDGLKFVYAMVALLSEGKYDVIISAPNRMIEMENLRPLKAELPAVWSDISNAMRGFKDHALHMLVLDEVLGLELSNFSRQLKLKPGIDDDHRVITAMSNDLWFRAMEVASEDTRRKNSLETTAHLEAMVLRTKPEANQWLHLNPRVAALGADAFQQGPVMITKIHAYLLKEVNLAENAGEKAAEFVNRMCQMTLETFWTQEVKGQEGFERTDSMLEGLGAGWTASFLAKVYPKVSHYLIKEFLQAVVRVSIVELIALFVTFGAESFVKGPAILLTDGIQNLRLDGLLTLIAITHGNLGGLMKLARCPEQMKERVRNLDMKKSTDSWNKIRDLRHTLIQYLLQQNRFGTEEEWEVHHRDHESRTGCKLDRVAFMEEVWTVIQSYGTQSILKTGLNQPLMREVLDKLDECEGRLSELLIDSATDESEANSPIKMTPQDDEGEVVYLSRTRRGTMRSKMVIDKINAMKMKLGSRVMPRRIGKTKVDSEISMKAGNSAKRKRVEEVVDLGQGDYQLSGTDRILTDIAMVPPILMAGIKSTGYKSKRSDRTLTGATLEMEILSQCGESKMRDFKPSPMNHGKGSVAGQLTPVEYNRLTVSETVSIDEPTGGYMEMLEYRNSARGYVMALEDEKAMEGYLETMLRGTTLKQKAYGTLASSDVQAETIEQLVSLPWKAVVLRYFEEEMRTTPRIHALVAVPYVRTELQLRFAWCMMGLTREEYDSEERKRSKEEKVFLMTNLRDLIVQEGAAVACAKRRDALCFIRFLIEQISVPALNTCVKMLREGDERTKALFLLALLDMQQSKPMRVNMKEPEELEPMKKIDEIRRFSNKELRLTKESMGALPKSSEYCGPIKKKSYSYVSAIIGIAYNPFLSEDIRDCFFDYEQAVLLRFWTSRIVTIKSVNNPQAKLGLVLEEEVTAPSVPKSDKRVEFGLGFSDELLRTSLMAVWELMRPSWCPSPNADSILRATQDIQRELNADCNLRDLNIIYNVMITASKSNGEDKVELPGWGPEDWVKPGSCLAEVCGLEGHVCGNLDCVKTLEKQHKQLTVLFGNVVMKARTETELIADCHGGTDVNLVTALGFYSMFGSLESLLNLEQKHEMVTAISVEVFPGVLQTEQKYIGKWREAIETEMNIRHSETYCRPSGARYLVGSTLAPMCKSKYPVHFVAVDVKSTRTIVDQAFSVPKCVRLARMSEKSYELLCKMFSAVPERTKEELESILGKKFMGYVSGNFSDFEKQKQRGSTVTDYNAVDENDEVHRVMMEVEPLLEASGKRNWRSIMLTHDEFPCHCLLQTWWYPKRSNLMLIWDSGELLSMGLPDSSQPVTIVIVGVMMAIRWLEAHVRENNRQEAPTREQLRKLDCLKDLDLFETMCKVLNIPMEVKKIWARKRLMPWFRANMTAWLYEYAKKHMSKHGRVYSEYQLDIGAGAFKRAFVTHRNAVTTAVKRISRTSERSGNEKAEMLKEDLERNVTLCLHNSFCRNREPNVDPLPCCKQRVEEQKCWRTASNSVRIANDVLQDTETENAESVSQEEEMEH